jgi:hypothetical protein
MKSEETIPDALVEPRKRLSLAWIVPIIALGIVVLVGIQAWGKRGHEVQVEFRRGHGLESGDPVRVRDIQIGEVESLGLSAEGDRVIAQLRIQSEFTRFMREGSRFWIERPEVGFAGVTGLDTILGAQYVGVIPGDGPYSSRFVGLSTPPFLQVIEPGDLEVVLESQLRAGMRVGGVVTYRGMPAGRIRSVGLSADATYVEARALIHARYAPLVRAKTRFFATSGVALGLSLEGLRLDVDSLESLVAGGIAFATPPKAGSRAQTGARFTLAERAEDDWLEWAPRVAIGEFGVGTTTPPPMQRAMLRWETRVLRIDRNRIGWMLPVNNGALVPTELLDAPSDVRGPTFVFEGTAIDPGSIESTSWGNRLSLLSLELPAQTSRFPTELLRGPKRDADGLAIAEMLLVWTGGEPIPVAAHTLKVMETVFRIDPAISFAPDNLGAPVTAASSGELVGLLLLSSDGRGKVAFLEAPSR